VRRGVGYFLCVRRPGAPLPTCPGARSAGWSRAARAAVWAVVAGLFLMYGAASPSDCCGDSAVTAITRAALPMAPGAAAASAVSPAGGQAGQAPAGPSAASLRQAVAPVTAGAASDCCDGRTLCSSRPPRDPQTENAGPPAQAGTVSLAVAPAPEHVEPAPGRAGYPPGRPGLPLPLFLGVSRT
jgi:hypothetical protein